MPGQVLQGRSRDGSLRPAVFPDGIDAAIARHQASSSAGPSVAARPPPRHLYGGAAAAPLSSVPSGRGLLGGATPLLSGRGATEDPQVHRDREFAMKLAHEPSAELPPAIVATAPPHSRMLADRLQRARHRGQSTYPYVSPVFFLALLGGFFFSLSKNSWGLVGASTNPWLGVDSDSLRESGGLCSSCIIEGDWWRVLSSLIVPAGLIHLFSITFLISASSSVCARAGLPPGELAACILAGGIIGSMTSAVAAPHTIHSTAGALGAAAVTAAIASILSVRRHVVTYGPVLMLAVLWLVAMLVSSLAPFVDTWAALSGGLAGGLCAAAFMAPYASKTASRSMERLVIAWQVTLTAVVVAAAVSVLASMLSMPRTGYKCSLCDDLTCQSFLGWSCSAAANRAGFCEIRVFPDSSAVLICPTLEEVEIAAVSGSFDTIDVDRECDARCGAAVPYAPPPEAPAGGGAGTGGADGDGAGDTDGDDGDDGGGGEPSPGTFEPIGGLLGPVEAPPDDGGEGSGGGAQFIDPNVGVGSGEDEVGATSR